MEGNSGVKKLAAFPYEMLNLLQQQFQQPQQQPNFMVAPEIKYLSSLDTELKNVLYDEKLPPEIKFNKYVELLTRYNSTMSSIKKPFEIEIKEKVPAITNVTNNLEQIQPLGVSQNLQQQQTPVLPQQSELIKNLPIKLQNKGKTLLQAISQNPNIKWDPITKIISIKGQPIEGSNIKENLQHLLFLYPGIFS